MDTQETGTKNNHSMKTAVLLPLAFIACLTTAQAAVVASWDAWAAGSFTGTADSVVSGFTATAVSESTDRALSTFTSNDGTFGTVAGANTSNTVGVLMREAGPKVLTVTLNNNTGSAYSISSLHFDYNLRGTGSPTEIKIDYISGGLGPASTTISTLSGLVWDGSYSSGAVNYPDYDFNLAPALSDTILANGESAVFTLTFNNGVGTNSGVLDNLAFQGTAVPEPSAALLAGLGALLLLRRRRN